MNFETTTEKVKKLCQIGCLTIYTIPQINGPYALLIELRTCNGEIFMGKGSTFEKAINKLWEKVIL